MFRFKIYQELKNNKRVQNNITDDLKYNGKEINIMLSRNTFLKEVDGNEETLKMLTIDRLKKLEIYYDDVIERNNKIIKELKNK